MYILGDEDPIAPDFLGGQGAPVGPVADHTARDPEKLGNLIGGHDLLQGHSANSLSFILRTYFTF